MKLYIGTKFYGHDSSVFIYNMTTKKTFAMSTERITRYKHDKLFPIQVIHKYLEKYKIDVSQIDEVILSHSFTMYEKKLLDSNFYENEILYRNFFNATYLKDYLISMRKFRSLSKYSKFIRVFFDANGIKILFNKLSNKKTSIGELSRNYLQNIFHNANIELRYYDHEYCHAISSYISSKFNTNTLLITMDGHGDRNVFAAVYSVDKEMEINFISESTSANQKFVFTTDNDSFSIEASLGGIYSYITYFLGFTPLADEGKVEALAAFGSNIDELINFLRENIYVENFKIIQNEDSLQRDLPLLLDKYRESKENIASSIQTFTEMIILEYITKIKKKYNYENICLSGGVFANVIINKRIFETLFKNIHIIPAMSDDGSSEGACYASLYDDQKNDVLKHIKSNYSLPYFGTEYKKEDVFLRLQKYTHKVSFKELDNNWYVVVAKMLVDGKIGALFRGRAEWGPRALGNRSIIARVNDKDIQKKMNNEIKRRPEFQPFCPSMIIDEKDRLFEMAYNNKHMTIAFQMKEEHIKHIPSSVHIDGTARVQFVSKDDNEDYYNLINEVKRLSGYGVMINTSFNKHGRTIVESPEDAIIDFLDTDMDYLFIEGYLVERKA